MKTHFQSVSATVVIFDPPKTIDIDWYKKLPHYRDAIRRMEEQKYKEAKDKNQPTQPDQSGELTR